MGLDSFTYESASAMKVREVGKACTGVVPIIGEILTDSNSIRRITEKIFVLIQEGV